MRRYEEFYETLHEMVHVIVKRKGLGVSQKRGGGGGCRIFFPSSGGTEQHMYLPRTDFTKPLIEGVRGNLAFPVVA